MNTPTAHPAIPLEPSDWFWAPWRGLDPLERPEAQPFDLESALQRLEQAKAPLNERRWLWATVPIPAAAPPEQAMFWFTALARSASKDRPWLAQTLAETPLGTGLGWEQGLAIVRQSYWPERFWMIQPLAELWSPEQIVRLILEARNPGSFDSTPFDLLYGFHTYLLPYLDTPSRAQLSGLLTPQLNPARWPSDQYTAAPTAWYLAAQLGGQGAALRALVESWPDGCFGQGAADYHQHPQLIVFGLDDPDLVARHLGRLGLRLTRPEDIRAWLAHTGLAQLGVVRDSILAEQNRDRAAELTEVFGLVQTAEAAPHMLALTLGSKAAGAAQSWLYGHPEQSVAGLLPLAEGRDRLAQAAVALLRRLGRRGQIGLLEAALGGLPDERAARLRAALLLESERMPALGADTPGWLDEALAQVKAAKLPAWLNPSELPPVLVGQRRLDAGQTAALLQALQRSPLDAPHPLVRVLAERADRASLAAFAWELFELWLQSDAPAKDSWAMQALGPLADDPATLSLAALVRLWPGESQNQRALKGLEVLAAVGSDTALMQIDTIARTVKFKALRGRAALALEEIAQRRGLSRAELEDRLVPDCGLDAQGQRVFDYGPRQFRFALGPDLKPLLRDAQGALRSDLPKPNAKDDPALAAQAQADWKQIKKQIADVVRSQALRLEQAMLGGRRWRAADFAHLLARHPVLSHLVRTLVWRAYAPDGAPGATFRVTEDGSYADMHDRPFALGPDAAVGLVHPLHASEAERNLWGELLADYTIRPPFPQLGRAVQRLEPHERGQTDITRFGQTSIPAATLVFGLDKQGWTRDAPGDNGSFNGHFKPFEQFGVTAVIQYKDGVAIGWITDAPAQRIHYVAFVPGLARAQVWPDHRERLPLEQVDPLVISEVLNDVAGIVARA